MSGVHSQPLTALPPLAPRVSNALRRHRFSDNRISVDGYKDGRVAIEAVAQWLEDASNASVHMRGHFLARVIVRGMFGAVASFLRQEAKR